MIPLGLGFISEKFGLFIVCDGFISSVCAMTMFKFADSTYNICFKPFEIFITKILTLLCFCFQVILLGKSRESFNNSDFVTIITSDRQSHKQRNFHNKFWI